MTRTAETAIKKVRRLLLLPKGTRVLAREHFQGVIDGITEKGDYVILFDVPVSFPSAGFQVYRGTFPVSDVREIK